MMPPRTPHAAPHPHPAPIQVSRNARRHGRGGGAINLRVRGATVQRFKSAPLHQSLQCFLLFFNGLSAKCNGKTVFPAAPRMCAHTHARARAHRVFYRFTVLEGIYVSDIYGLSLQRSVQHHARTGVAPLYRVAPVSVLSGAKSLKPFVYRGFIR